MSAQKFLGGFVAVFSDEEGNFADSESGPPLWAINMNLVAGQPLLDVKLAYVPHRNQ
jgi:hypothetical protein